jgi:transcriptional regulator with XRE-family HTH domain
MFNQLARRNLTDAERGRIALKLKESTSARARENQSLAGGDKKSEDAKSLPQNFANPILPMETRKELAKIAGVSHTTLAKIEKVDKEAPAPIREAMGKSISIDKAAKLNTALKDTPEAEREDEAKRLLSEAQNNEHSDEEKIFKALHNIISPATIDYGYVTDGCVDIYVKKSTAPVTEIAADIDGKIVWLQKLKELFLKRDTVSAATVNDDSHNGEIINGDSTTENSVDDAPATEDVADDDCESEDTVDESVVSNEPVNTETTTPEDVKPRTAIPQAEALQKKIVMMMKRTKA